MSATNSFPATKEKIKIKKEEVILPGNRAWRRGKQKEDRTKASKQIKDRRDFEEKNSAELRIIKVKNRVAKNRAKKAEREASPQVATKMKNKRLKKVAKQVAKSEKRKSRVLKFLSKRK